MHNKLESPVADLNWCRKCLTGFRNTTVCPQCKFTSDEPFNPLVQEFVWLMIGAQLRAVIPDLSYFAEEMRSGPLKELLEGIAANTGRVSESGMAKISPFNLQLWIDLVPLYQPSETLRAVFLEISNQLVAEVRAEFLSRPQIVALNLQDVLPPEERFSQNRYAPFPPLRLPTEEEALKEAFSYLATREALSGENWREHFSKALEHGVLSIDGVAIAAESWRTIASQDQQLEKPLTPWLLTLKKLGCHSKGREHLAVFTGFANHCLQVKNYYAAEEIAQATLRLAHEVSDAEGYTKDNQRREALLFNLKGILANCAAMSDGDDDLAVDKARSELVGSSMEAISGTFEENVDGPLDSVEETLIPIVDVLVQMQFADQCFNNGAFEKAELKYNRIIFTLKNSLENDAIDTEDESQSHAERIMKVLPGLISVTSTYVPLVRATVRLAETKIKQADLLSARELLESALHYANATVQRSTSALADLKNRSGELPITATLSATIQISSSITKTMNSLKVIIYGNLAHIYDERGERQKAVIIAKKARKLLSEVKPSDLIGFAISYETIMQLCEKLKK